MCRVLEQELRQYKLWANLIPQGSWEANLRKVMAKREWDVLRRAAYAHYNHSCAICGVTNVQLHAHEEWEYIYEKNEQRLGRIVALCPPCHRCNHLGHSKILAKEGKLNLQELIIV